MKRGCTLQKNLDPIAMRIPVWNVTRGLIRRNKNAKAAQAIYWNTQRQVTYTIVKSKYLHCPSSSFMQNQ